MIFKNITLNISCFTGIGFETAKELVRRGAKVILACRDFAKAEEACGMRITIKVVELL
jgi:NAD(P)-dependent dehydrogenase (short-subunit alcohol dehydrogenase family)